MSLHSHLSTLLRLGLALVATALTLLVSVPAKAAISFAPPVTYAMPSGSPWEMTTGDFDGDGKTDLAVYNDGYLTMFYGNGNGTLAAPVRYAVADNNEPGWAEPVGADLNGDGRLDLAIVVAYAARVFVLLNNDNRTFANPASYSVGDWPYGITAGDFNADGRPDLATSNHNGHSLSVLINRGDGTFADGGSYAGGSYPGKITNGDFNRDGHLDLAMSHYLSNNVLVYFGNGAGSFTYNASYGVGRYAVRVVTADFNRDGIPDLATGNTYSDNVSVLINRGDGTFEVSPFYPANQYPHIGAAADFDADGDADLAFPNNGTNYFTLLENIGDGLLAAPRTVVSGGNDVCRLTIGDFNGDRSPDVVAENLNSGTVSLFLNTSNTPPALTFITPPRGAGVRWLTGITGTASDGAGGGIASVQVRLRRGSDLRWWKPNVGWVALSTDLDVAGTESWQVTSTLPSGTNLPEGAYHIYASATDTSGLTSARTNTIVVDRQAPVSLRFTRPVDGGAVPSFATIAGTTADNTGGSGIARVTVSLRRLADGLWWNGSAWGASETALRTDNRSPWKVTATRPTGANLPDGRYFLRAVATDRAGNSRTAYIYCRVDSQAPSLLQFTTPRDGATVTSLALVEGAARDSGSGVTRVMVRIRQLNSLGTSTDDRWWNGTGWQSTPANLAAHSTATSPDPAFLTWRLTGNGPSGDFLPAGDYALYAYAYDAAGNFRLAAISVVAE
jgi:hypothetical protein